MRSRSFSLSLSLLAVVVGCTSPPDEGTDSTSSELTMLPCGTPLAEVDGVYAYSNGDYTNSGYSCGGMTNLGTYLYQCVEFAQRYMNQRFGIAPVWPVEGAAEMCSSQPAGVQTHYAGSGYIPKRGDLVVWGAVPGNRWGHVAVVKSVGAGSIEIVEQNASVNGSNGVRTLQGSPLNGYGGSTCFVTALQNQGGGGGGNVGPSGTCSFGDGLYCGQNGGGSDAGKLYRCASGQPTAIESCALGCEWRPYPENDRCRTTGLCPYGDGSYCGGNGITGDANVLFSCGGGKIRALQRCARGCTRMPVGLNDACAP